MLTSRQSIARRQGRAVLKRSPRLPLGTSSAHRGYVAKIDWADAPIVELEASSITMIEADIRSDRLVELRSFTHQIAAGEVLHLVASEHLGYYFLVRWDGEAFRCTCPSGCVNGHCGHQEDVADYVALASDLHEEVAAAAASGSVETYRDLLEQDMASLVLHLAGREISVPLIEARLIA